MRMTTRLPLTLAAAIVLAGCPAPLPTTPQGSPSAPVESSSPTASPSSGQPSAAPSAAASGASAEPSAAASATISPTPSLSPSAAATETGIVKGRLLDAELKAMPDGTVVTATSLDATQPYTASVQTADGNYVFNAIPLNVQIRLTATRTGWTSRTRVIVVRRFDPRLGDRNVYNFGGKASDTDQAAPSYFMSPYPEIEAVVPTDQDASLPLDKMSYKLTLSEPLDAANRRRLGAAFQIVPNNTAALEDGGALPLDQPATLLAANKDRDAELLGLHVGDADVAGFPKPPYSFRQNSAFLGGLKVSKFEWDAAGRNATFLLDAPIKTDDQDEAEYAFMLVLRDKDKIVDGEGKALGMGKDMEFGSYASLADKVIYNAVREPSVNLNEDFATEKSRWADTHVTYTRFRVLADRTKPKLLSVVARRNFTDAAGTDADRIELTFDEPMVAYPRVTSAGLVSLNNYILATSPDEAELTARKILNDGSAEVISTAALATDVADKFKDKTALVISTNASSGGNFKVAFSVIDPKTVVLSLPGGAFPLDANFIKVYVGSDSAKSSGVGDFVADPAGNRIDASTETLVGPIL